MTAPAGWSAVGGHVVRNSYAPAGVCVIVRMCKLCQDTGELGARFCGCPTGRQLAAEVPRWQQ